MREDPLAGRVNGGPEDEAAGHRAEHQKVRADKFEQELRLGRNHPIGDSMIVWKSD